MLTMTLPFAAVVRDSGGAKYMVNRKGRLTLTPQYRASKENVHNLAMAARTRQGVRNPIGGTLQLTARVWFPDLRRRDAGNLRKLVTDALSGAWYVDDAQLHREVWERAGVDRENPRIELALEPMEAA